MYVKREERIAAEGWGGGIMQSAVRLSRHAPLNMIDCGGVAAALSNSLPKQRGGEGES